MPKLALAIVYVAVFSASALVAQDLPYGNVKLLDGYKYKRSSTVDTINGLIFKPDGLRIEFESGISEGYAVSPKDKKKYTWFREQTFNGHRVYIALSQPGAGIVWSPENKRSQKNSQILIVTFPRQFGPNDAANFYAEVLNDMEIAEALLMILTFDPTK